MRREVRLLFVFVPGESPCQVRSDFNQLCVHNSLLLQHSNPLYVISCMFHTFPTSFHNEEAQNTSAAIDCATNRFFFSRHFVLNYLKPSLDAREITEICNLMPVHHQLHPSR